MHYFKIDYFGKTKIEESGPLQRQGEMLYLTSPKGEKLNLCFHESALGRSVQEITRSEAENFWKSESDNRHADSEPIQQELSDAEKLHLRWLNADEREKLLIQSAYYERHNFGR